MRVTASAPVDAFIQHVVTALTATTFVRLLLSQPATPGATVERIIGRLITLRDQPHLSLTLREARRDTTKNLELAAVPRWLREQIPAEFRSAVLETTAGNWQLHAPPAGQLQLVAHRATQAVAPPRGHDAAKPGWLDASAQPWLTLLGICGADGRVRASMADKHRQLGRYLEILSHLIRDCGWKKGDRLTLTDMGSGKGYLTFGAWHLLRHGLELQADVVGVEARPDLVDKTNQVARATGATGLRFVRGAIADVDLPRSDVLIALHACNTATDDAIRRGIMGEAQLIVVSPCCHQELRPQLGRPEPLAPILQHGIMAERFSEWLTDGLRALHLQRAGYATKLMEFVPSEHTPRNLLLAGVRQAAVDASARAQATAQIAALKKFADIQCQALDDLL